MSRGETARPSSGDRHSILRRSIFPRHIFGVCGTTCRPRGLSLSCGREKFWPFATTTPAAGALPKSSPAARLASQSRTTAANKEFYEDAHSPLPLGACNLVRKHARERAFVSGSSASSPPELFCSFNKEFTIIAAYLRRMPQ